MAMIKLYNSLAREKQIFEPIDPRHVRVYACGPTVYNYAHIGNARMAVVFDLWARVLRAAFPDAKVSYVSNITDIEDRIIDAARAANLPISAITEKYTAIYNADMASLGAGQPDVQPKATEHLPEMIAMIGTLIDRGHAYEAEGHVLFHVPSDPSYGVLSGRSRDEQVAGARVEVAPYKKDAADFVLWKPSVGDQPGWDSPWGYGRPGWHIECSAMAEKHLGLPFDIHGGGADLKFPHHENEIAQSCCAHGTPDDPKVFARYWVHNGFVTVDGEKMSKSLGNFLVVHDLVKKYKGEVLRLTLLSAHYRQPLDWSEALLEQNRKALDKFYDPLLRSAKFVAVHVPEEDWKIYPPVLEALYDDLNTPLAISKMHELSKQSWRTDLSEAEIYETKALLLGTGKLLGILQAKEKEDWFETRVTRSGAMSEDEVAALVAKRQDAKKAKDFATADAIRKDLDEKGVVIEDTPQGPQWKWK